MKNFTPTRKKLRSREPDLNRWPKDCYCSHYSPPLYQLSYRGSHQEEALYTIINLAIAPNSCTHTSRSLASLRHWCAWKMVGKYHQIRNWNTSYMGGGWSSVILALWRHARNGEGMDNTVKKQTNIYTVLLYRCCICIVLVGYLSWDTWHFHTTTDHEKTKGSIQTWNNFRN